MESSELQQYFFLISGHYAGSLVVSENSLKISSKRHKTIEEFDTSWSKKISLDTKVEISFDAIKKISLEEGETELHITYRAKFGIPGERKFEFVSDDERDIFLHLMQKNGFMKTSDPMTPLRATLPHFFGLLVTLGIGWLLYFDAIQIESGAYVESNGNSRSDRNERLFAWVAAKLGSTGVLAIGGAICAYILYLIWKRFSNPPNQTVLSRNN